MIPVTWPEFGALHPFAPAEPGAGLRASCSRELEDVARRDHRLRRASRCSRTPARRASTRACSSSARYHASARRGAPQRLPHPRLGARHQPGQRGDGGHQGRRRSPATSSGNIDLADLEREGRASTASDLARADGHLPLDPRRVRGGDPRDLRDRPRARRPGLHGRRQHERAGRPDPPRRHRRRRLPPQPAQDLLHPARRRRPGHGPDRRGGAPRAVPARPSRWPTRGGEQAVGPVSAAPCGSASILPISWVYIAHDGRRRA